MWSKHQVTASEVVVFCLSSCQGYKGLKIYSQTWLESIWSLSCRDVYSAHCSCVSKNRLNFFFFQHVLLYFSHIFSLFSLHFPFPDEVMLVQARFFSCQPTLPSDPQSGSQSRPPMPLRMKETRVYWWIRSECYHNFTRLPKCCPLGYPGDSPHTLSPHTQKRSSIKPSSLLPKEFVFASLWKRTSYSRIELAAHSGPVLFCAPSGSSPTVFAFSRCGAELTDSPLRSSSTAELLWEGQSKASGFPRWRRAFHSFHNLHKLGACVRLEPCAF